jgi:hypothetical protein
MIPTHTLEIGHFCIFTIGESNGLRAWRI